LHIPVEALNLEAPFVKAPAPINPTARMVQRCTMALDHQFLAAQPIRSQATPQPTLQQITPSAPHQWRKRQRGTDDAPTEFGTPSADQPPTPFLGRVV